MEPGAEQARRRACRTPLALWFCPLLRRPCAAAQSPCTQLGCAHVGKTSRARKAAAAAAGGSQHHGVKSQPVQPPAHKCPFLISAQVGLDAKAGLALGLMSHKFP